MVKIKLEFFQVPGRLGLLVTLLLIAANVYSSVEGPSNRGLSYIEIWMIGIQIPILLAVFEYGIILALRKQEKGISSIRKMSKIAPSSKIKNDMERKLDKWTFFGSSAFIIVFNIIYWSAAHRSKMMK